MAIFNIRSDAAQDIIDTAQDTLNNSHRSSIPMSKVLSGILSLSNTVKTLNFDAVTYNGNGGTQNIPTGISSVDFTVASNGSGYWLDRTVNQVKTDAGTVVASGEIEVNTSKVHTKCRSGISSHFIFDGIRGAGSLVETNTTGAEQYGISTLSSFNSNGFSIGTNGNINTNTQTYVAYQTLYTHIKWGVTSQGKFQIEAYNPVTNEGMIYYIGSGVAGHQISHSMGVEIDWFTCKTLETANDWAAYYGDETDTLFLNLTNATVDGVSYWNDTKPNSTYITLGDTLRANTADNEYIMYYKCKSETWTIGTYQGTGVAGNFIETKDVNGVARKPRRVVIKAISATGGWWVVDSARGLGTSSSAEYIGLNVSLAEATASSIDMEFSTNGFIVGNSNPDFNASGVTLLYLVEFDTDNTGTSGSYFDKATATTNLQIADGLVSISSGYDSQGAINKVISKSGTITPTGGWI